MRQRWGSLRDGLRAWPAIPALVAAGVGLVVLVAATQKPFTVVVEGESQTVWSHARTVAGVVRSAGIRLQPGDETLPQRAAQVMPGDTIHLTPAREVEVHFASGSKTLSTASRIPANILAAAGIPLLPADSVWVDGLRISDPAQPLPSPPRRVRHAAASSTGLRLDGVQHEIRTAGPSLAQALEDTGERWYEGDRFDADPAGALSPEVGLDRSVLLTIASDGVTAKVRAVGPTVAAALLQAGVPLQGLDWASPGADAPVPKNGAIQVVRVRDEVLIEQEPIPYETRYEPDPEGLIDTQTVLDPGAFGIRANRVRVRKEDGIEVARQVEGEWVAREPEPRAVGYGTKVEIKTLDTEYGPLQYYRAVPMYATSYSPCRLGIPECDNITASGAILKKGIAALLVRWYRYMVGSQVYVPGYGIATIADTGGGIPGRYWIDLGYEDHDYQSWHDWVTVYFLTPVPQNPMWVLN
ncbi:MAG: ubiquitin-like domain-containing protein [Anaerolineales bacterium]|nr:ubiquitin-like domain-containing protein [Anaerolineales bacterium]